MKRRLRLLSIYIIMVCCFIAMSGCTGKTYDGKYLVDKAKSLHTGLEAAHITVTDVSDSNNEVVVQEIWYRFAGDIMQYMYIGRDAETGEEYYEFNNGTELDTWKTGDADWSFAARGTEGYYNYSRTTRHYFADGARLLEDYPDAVRESKVIGSESIDVPEGVRHINLFYDNDMGKTYSSMKDIENYISSYVLDADGYCTDLKMSYEKDGKSSVYTVRTERTDPKATIERKEPSAH